MFKSNMDVETNIVIDLENGIYCLGGYSATGKTRLAKVLRTIQKKTRDVISFSYDDLLVGSSLEQMLKLSDGVPKVVMLDRFDLYKDLYTDILNDLGSKSIVLIDCKTETPVDLQDDQFALLLMKQNKIEVKL